VGTHYAFTGRELDPDTRLYYYRARWYDAVVGRFIGEDGIGFAGRDANLVRYVANSPGNAVDPTGYTIAHSGPGDREVSEEVRERFERLLELIRYEDTPAGAIANQVLTHQMHLRVIWDVRSPHGVRDVDTVGGSTGIRTGTVHVRDTPDYLDPGIALENVDLVDVFEDFRAMTVIAHELGHAIGLTDPVNIVLIENPFRRAMGLPERTVYIDDEGRVHPLPAENSRVVNEQRRLIDRFRRDHETFLRERRREWEAFINNRRRNIPATTSPPCGSYYLLSPVTPESLPHSSGK
jgi:RHS repeat-associated protein